MMRLFLSLIAVLPLIVPQPVLACLWDSETLAMERQRFPEAHELIMGMFVRHSETYYEWRVEKILAKEQDEWALIDFDDLAVAYDKLGQQDKAIETILEKMKRWPEQGRYESEANLGTFYIHSGQYEEGLVHINKAIEINPDAHFGREVYQKLLVEYVLKQRAEGATLPLYIENSAEQGGFVRYVLSAQGIVEEEKRVEEINKAVKGVLGMMRFGHHDSPILLEALGDLFRYGEWNQDALNLANRAYVKAAYENREKKRISKSYLQKFLPTPDEPSEQPTEEGYGEKFISELNQANAYFSKIQKDEQEWIAAGKDLDKEFSEKYYEEPGYIVRDHRADRSDESSTPTASRFNIADYSDTLFLILVAPGLAAICYILFRERKQPEPVEEIQES